MFKLPSFTLSILIVRAIAHAVVTDPIPREYGPAAESACGSAVYDVLTSDLTGPIENAEQKIDSSYDAEACHLYLCRGAQFDDNVDNTRIYEPGTKVSMKVNMVAHHTGYANVSVVDLAAQKPISSLFVWPVYADESIGPSKWPKNETDFEVTVPDLEGACADAGACAIQWFWYATSNSQTYESCVDFTQ
ncbi:chitin binding [Moniliophthora roreri MCA 2997]|uniref:Chitin binding n=1 Tax=Moniliophthora roreri (strain MCA 2997) TaxID=1381753 RepID=V2YIY7_MONRO|nr:chitin binding [Moniliophthora roreri MCA 2997]